MRSIERILIWSLVGGCTSSDASVPIEQLPFVLDRGTIDRIELSTCASDPPVVVIGYRQVAEEITTFRGRSYRISGREAQLETCCPVPRRRNVDI